jgi:hypothetical protein
MARMTVRADHHRSMTAMAKPESRPARSVVMDLSFTVYMSPLPTSLSFRTMINMSVWSDDVTDTVLRDVAGNMDG